MLWDQLFQPVNLSSPLLGSLVATPVIPFAVVQLLQQPLVAYQITYIKTLGRLSSDAYHIYINTPVSTIVGVASLLT